MGHRKRGQCWLPQGPQGHGQAQHGRICPAFPDRQKISFPASLWDLCGLIPSWKRMQTIGRREFGMAPIGSFPVRYAREALDDVIKNAIYRRADDEYILSPEVFKWIVSARNSLVNALGDD